MNHTNTQHKQRGVALIAALVVLVVLTLIGVTAMNTTTLGEKMAFNMQEKYAAFHVAETGVNHAMIKPDSVSLGVVEKTIPDLEINSDTKAVIKTRFRQQTDAPIAKNIDDIYSATSNIKAAYFDIVSQGQAGSHATSTLRVGMYQLMPGQ